MDSTSLIEVNGLTLSPEWTPVLLLSFLYCSSSVDILIIHFSSSSAGLAFKAGNEPDGISRVLDGGYTADWKPGDRLPLKINSPPSRGGQGIY